MFPPPGGGSIIGASDGKVSIEVKMNNTLANQGFEVDSDGSMPFYLIDGYQEETDDNGTVYLFGKVKSGSTYPRCCVVVKGVQRCVYAVPTAASVFGNDRVKMLEKEFEKSQLSSSTFETKLLETASELRSEINAELIKRNVSSVSMAPVKSMYHDGEPYALKICYPFKDPPLPSDLRGEKFDVLLRTHCSALQTFLVESGVKGPSWLSISKFSICHPSQRVSYCEYEVTVECPEDIYISTSSKNIPHIPLVSSALNLKTIFSERLNVNENVSAFCLDKAKGCISSTAIVVLQELNYFVLAFESRLYMRNDEIGLLEVVSDEMDKSININIAQNIVIAVAGGTHTFVTVKQRIENALNAPMPSHSVTSITTMDQVSDMIVDMLNTEIMFPMGYDILRQHEPLNRVKLLLVGTNGGTHGVYLIQKRDGVDEYYSTRTTNQFSNIGTGDEQMILHQTNNPGHIPDLDNGVRFCVDCVKKAAEHDELRCGGHIHVFMVRLNQPDGVRPTDRRIYEGSKDENGVLMYTQIYTTER